MSLRRVKKGNQPSMHPRKRANTPPISISSSEEQGEESKWQAKRPCKFQQLQRDSVMDILSRLSIETLFNCRCVCKAWFSIISDPQFAHLRLSRLPIGILIKTLPPIRRSLKLDFTQIQECAGSHFQLEKMRFTSKNSLPISDFDLINTCNGFLCLSGVQGDDPLYVCNPILGEFITIPPSDKGMCCRSFVGLGFSAATNEYKVLQTSSPDNYLEIEAEIYTIGTGVWRSLGSAPNDLVELPFNAFLHGALHWVSRGLDEKISEFIHSFNFEREKFQPLPLPSSFVAREKKFSDDLKLGVFEDRLLLCVFDDDDSSQFDIWVMKDYGVPESWTKFLVIENLYERELSCDFYEPMVFLSNGEIIMSFNDLLVVCYNKKRKRLKETKITRTQSEFHAMAYSPCFVSLQDVSKGVEVKRVKDSKKSEELFAEGSDDCAGPGMPAHKSTKLNSGYGSPALEENLPRAISSPVSVTLSISLQRVETKCGVCGAHLGYVHGDRRFPVCHQCLDAGSS